jgi:hypothetical protein
LRQTPKDSEQRLTSSGNLNRVNISQRWRLFYRVKTSGREWPPEFLQDEPLPSGVKLCIEPAYSVSFRSPCEKFCRLERPEFPFPPTRGGGGAASAAHHPPLPFTQFSKFPFRLNRPTQTLIVRSAGRVLHKRYSLQEMCVLGLRKQGESARYRTSS